MSVVIGAFDGADRPDLAIGESTPSGGRVVILLNDGTGRFSAASTGPVKVAGSSRANSLAVGDFNSDHRDDLAVIDDSSTDVTILLQR